MLLYEEVTLDDIKWCCILLVPYICAMIIFDSLPFKFVSVGIFIAEWKLLHEYHKQKDVK